MEIRNIVDDIRKMRFFWAGHEKKAPLYTCAIIQVLCGSPKGVRPRGRPRLRCEDQVQSKDVERVRPDDDWRVLAEDRERWRGTCMSVWS